MMNLFYDLIPLLLFFISFKYYGIYVATTVGIVVTALQVLITFLWKKNIDKKQLITLIVFVFFGGMTLYFHNPIFVKWKPTIVFWIFGLLFLGSQYIGKKNLVQRMFSTALEKQDTTHPISSAVWKKLNLAWALFFIFMGSVNIYVAYSFSTDTWVNFKLYGIMGLLILFSIGQALYLARYLTVSK